MSASLIQKNGTKTYPAGLEETVFSSLFGHLVEFLMCEFVVAFAVKIVELEYNGSCLVLTVVHKEIPWRFWDVEAHEVHHEWP